LSNKPRVHEVAAEMGMPAKDVLLALRRMGEYVKGPSSSIEPAVARRLKAALPPALPVFPALHDERVSRVAAHIAALPRQLPELIDLLIEGSDSSQDVPAIMIDAARPRNFYFVPDRAFEQLSITAKSIPTMQQGDLLAPAGVVIIAHSVLSDRRRRFQVMAWVEAGDRIHIATTTLIVNLIGEGRATATHTLSSNHRRGADGYSELGSVTMGRTLAALSKLVPVRILSSGEATPSPGSAAVPVPTNETQVIYATHSALSLGATEHEGLGMPRSTRWKVSGHWRDQWYPSANDRKRIWISEHEAGAAEGELRQRERVYVLAPRNNYAEQ
jgi:hypothetical protein